MQTEEALPSNAATEQPDRPRRRSRIPLSCEPCRIRKLKCNREKPCQNCTARHEDDACRFRGPRNGPAAVARRDGNGDAMRQRIDHLEDLVKRLAAERGKVSSIAPETKPDATATLDSKDMAGGAKTLVDGIQSVYLGGDDWYAVLQEINELKRSWSEEEEEEDRVGYTLEPVLPYTVDGSSLLFNQVKPIERIEILSAVPPRPATDRLIAWFFNRETFPISIPPILHEPTFMLEYNEHWREPSRTGFIWLGLLFSILGITMLAYHQNGEPPEYQGISESLFQLYRMRTAQCLQSGDISKCLPYTVETLRFNATAELNRKDDNRRGLWIMTGVVVRAAVNMGYHRDPAISSPAVPAVRAEYRRRVWHAVATMDDMASFLGGFPRMTAAVRADTAEPRNLHDWELEDDAAQQQLPPSRPLEEPTPVTYLIVKGRLFRALGRIADLHHGAAGAGPAAGVDVYETVLDIDRAVNEAFAAFPAHMRLPAAEDLHGPPPSRTAPSFSNLSLHCMYHKAMCMLHRRYLARARVGGGARFHVSRDRCLASARALLAYQHGLDRSLYQIAFTRQLLALAAMVLFLELELRRRGPGDAGAASPDSAVLLQALERSCTLWGTAVGVCDEASRVHRNLVGMLSGLGIGTSMESGLSQIVTPEDLSDLGSSLHFDVGFSFEDGLSNTDFDWAAWDAFIGDGSHEPSPIY